MPIVLNRRKMLRQSLFTGLAVSSASKWSAAMPSDQPISVVPTWKTEWKQLGPDVFAYIQGGGPSGPFSGIANAGVIAGGSELTVIDTLAAPLQTKAFISEATTSFPNKPFHRVLYTHHHGDHIDGALYFPGADRIATEFCKKTIGAMKPLPPWDRRDGWAEGGESHQRLLPTQTFEKTLTLYAGEISVKVIEVGPAHTWGDLMVYIPERKILFAGDVAFFYIAPYAHWGHIGKWIELLQKILDMDVEHIVPGHGPLGNKQMIAEQLEYLEFFRREARKRYDEGMTPGRAAASIPLGRFRDWRGSRDRLPMNTVRAFHEFNNTLTPEMDQAGTKLANEEFAELTGYHPEM